jgi:SAM-dependent methyltransferase
MREIARVLRPQGRLLFIEHVRGAPRLARWQDRLERPWGWVAGGCHPNRDTVAGLRASGLRVESADRGELPKAPPLVRPLVAGVAVRDA